MGNTTSNLSGLTVVITGCDTGFGFETTRVLLRHGMNVVAGCLTESGRENLERVVEREGDGKGWGKLKTCRLDVTLDESVEGFKACVEEFAEGGIYALINNAGIGESGPCELLPLSLHKRIFEVNYFGGLRILQAFLPSLRRFSRSSSLRPRIINIASVAGRIPCPSLVAYSASKHAFRALTEGMRMEVRQFGIKMVCVEPGFARTPIVERSDEEVRRVAGMVFGEDREARRAYGADEGYVEEMVGRGKDVVLSPLTMKASYVVNWIVQAVEARSPKPRYVIGFLAHFLILAYSIVPSWIMDGIVSRAMLFPGKKGIANF